MPFILGNRVLETSTSTGTGTFTLAGAVTGYRTFAASMAVSDTTTYLIEGVDGSGVPTGEWEAGVGTYSGTNTLTRTTVMYSSNSGSVVTFSAGTKRVSITALAFLLNNPATYDAGNSGSSITINALNGTKQTVLLNAATPAITITNLNLVPRLRLVLRQDGTGGRVPTFTISGRTLLYQGGSVPPFSTGANARDVRQFTDDAVSAVVDVEAGIGYAAP